MTKYNTNLASEFYVLSMLHRLGASASLTLGNRKAVDIFIVKEDGTSVSIDVKGLVSRYDWPADNVDTKGKKGHFLVLVCFEGKIAEPSQLPSVWIIPSKDIKRFSKKYKKRTVISRSLVMKDGQKYQDAWNLLFV